MSVSIGSFPLRGSGNEWLGRLCLRYVNRVHQRRTGLFVEMWAELPLPEPGQPPPIEIVTLHHAGGIPALVRLHNEAYVGAADYRRAGWVEGLALQTAAGYDPSLIFIGMRNGVPVGFCMARKRGQAGRITGLAVRPEWRGRGFGTALLWQALSELSARGATRVRLSACAEDLAGQRLYRKVGFRDGRRSAAAEYLA
jgi:ribosomal protein S18 acetylase RimI-like enzyme